jgi:hypothetical protein
MTVYQAINFDSFSSSSFVRVFLFVSLQFEGFCLARKQLDFVDFSCHISHVWLCSIFGGFSWTCIGN